MEARRKVLIIDDEEDCCLLMSKFFELNNYSVFVAHTLNEGIELLQKELPEFIFLDNNLPDGLGWNIAKKIAETYPQSHITLISAYEHNRGSDTMSFQMWEKPISITKLQQFVEDTTVKA